MEPHSSRECVGLRTPLTRLLPVHPLVCSPNPEASSERCKPHSGQIEQRSRCHLQFRANNLGTKHLRGWARKVPRSLQQCVGHRTPLTRLLPVHPRLLLTPRCSRLPPITAIVKSDMFLDTGRGRDRDRNRGYIKRLCHRHRCHIRLGGSLQEEREEKEVETRLTRPSRARHPRRPEPWPTTFPPTPPSWPRDTAA